VIDQILADEQLDVGTGETDRLLWPLTDNLGSVRDLAEFDEVTGITAIVDHIIYSAFGEILSKTNPSLDHLFGYTGRETDPESDLTFYRARYYDPLTGRFISEDPIGFAAGDLNVNRYVGNGPTNATDPSGLDGEPDLSGTYILTMPPDEIAKRGLNHPWLRDYRYIGSRMEDLQRALGFKGRTWGAFVPLRTEDGRKVTSVLILQDEYGTVRYALPARIKGKDGEFVQVGYTVYCSPEGVVNHFRKLFITIQGGINAFLIASAAAFPPDVTPPRFGPLRLPSTVALAPRSLTNIQARDWYNARVAHIDVAEQQMRAAGKSPKEIFETTTRLRNEAKIQARELMQDQALAKSLPPPKTPEEILRKYGGDYEKAIEACKRTNPKVNKAIEEMRGRGER